jgi:hypothetical protein
VAHTTEEVAISDNSGSRGFTQRARFAHVYDRFESVIETLALGDSLRVISLCSEFSTPTPQTIRQQTLGLIQHIHP